MAFGAPLWRGRCRGTSTDFFGGEFLPRLVWPPRLPPRDLVLNATNTPAQQREILKLVHDSTSLLEIRECLIPADDGRLHPVLDAETAIDCVCYLTSNINDGFLSMTENSATVLDHVVKTVVESLDVAELRSTEKAQLVWIMETVEREQRQRIAGGEPRWTLHVMKAMAERQTQLERQASLPMPTPRHAASGAEAISTYATKDLVNLTISISNTPLFASSAPVVRFLLLVLEELMSRIAKPHIRSAFAIRELSLLAAAVATAFETVPATSMEARGAYEGFLMRLWADGMKPKVANRHSSWSGKSCFEDLKRYLFAYLRVFAEEPPERMLEGISSYITRLLRSGLESDAAVELTGTFSDLAALLEFFAYYASRSGPSLPSISVVELVSVVGACMRQLTLVNFEADVEMNDTNDANDDVVAMDAIASLLDSHVRLKLRPAEETLLALVPHVRTLYRNKQEPAALMSILGSFEAFGFDPGRSLTSL